MELTNKIICDTGVISDYLTKIPKVYKKVNFIGIENIMITPVILSELNRWLSVYKGFDKKKRSFITKFIQNLPIIHINENISKMAVEITNENNSLEIPDILIGATAVYHKIPIYTLNKKHFKQMKGIELY